MCAGAGGVDRAERREGCRPPGCECWPRCECWASCECRASFTRCPAAPSSSRASCCCRSLSSGTPSTRRWSASSCSRRGRGRCVLPAVPESLPLTPPSRPGGARGGLSRATARRPRRGAGATARCGGGAAATRTPRRRSARAWTPRTTPTRAGRPRRRTTSGRTSLRGWGSRCWGGDLYAAHRTRVELVQGRGESWGIVGRCCFSGCGPRRPGNQGDLRGAGDPKQWGPGVPRSRHKEDPPTGAPGNVQHAAACRRRDTGGGGAVCVSKPFREARTGGRMPFSVIALPCLNRLHVSHLFADIPCGAGACRSRRVRGTGPGTRGGHYRQARRSHPDHPERAPGTNDIG
ncbi:hypothetical protein DFJ74DRAFT_531504 [Hyaloraphidium curvatum]|nr:hypothetical protein DFJ74DRAFT_531504 [Hyaloraphidium curvatum]